MPDRYLDKLEAETIYILREAYNKVSPLGMLWSIGKDSNALLWMVKKAFFGKVPFPLLHIDTTWEFAEMAQFRDRLAEELDLNVLVHINEEALELGVHPIESGSVKYNDQMKTVALKQALDKYGFDAALGGARRDEEKSRAKERVFSVRTPTHGWDPKAQRPR